MSVYEFENRKPIIKKGSFIYESADVIGEVDIGKNCYIGPGARIRGDYGSITIGDNTAIEENVVIHARPGDVTTIGSHVTIGHAAIIHNATIQDWAVIGMGSIISDWAVIGEWGVVAEGAVVKNKQHIPKKSIAVGIPAKIIGEISSDYIKQWTLFKNIYVDLAQERLPKSLKKIS
jgi:phenylacetic acid degradation protein